MCIYIYINSYPIYISGISNQTHLILHFVSLLSWSKSREFRPLTMSFDKISVGGIPPNRWESGTKSCPFPWSWGSNMISTWFQPIWKYLKNIREIQSFPSVGVNKILWNHTKTEVDPIPEILKGGYQPVVMMKLTRSSNHIMPHFAMGCILPSTRFGSGQTNWPAHHQTA